MKLEYCGSRRREHRREQEKLKKVKTLGEAGEDVDNLAEWVTRNKKAEKKAREQERLKAVRVARQLEEQVSRVLTSFVPHTWESHS